MVAGKLTMCARSAAGRNWVKCKWFAKARLGGDKGLAKGCWIEIKK
jgi:hypothetical protein